MKFRCAIAAIILMCSSCAQPSDRFGSRPVGFEALSGWQDDNHAQALQTFLASCSILARKARPASNGSGLTVTESVWQSLCDDAGRAQGSPQAARSFFERRFVPYRITNNDREQGLFTGYYEPVLYGSRHQGHDFIYPVYLAPPDLAHKSPYYSRQEIDGGALNHRKLEILWVDDPVMLFFLHIQGSGRVKLSDGREIRIGYAGKNGHPYVALGKIMGEEGLMPKDQINFFTLRQWLYDNRDQAFAMMQRNPSYVFFVENNGPGPLGASGAVLTPMRSLAVDGSYIPYGLPLYLEVELPPEPQRDPVLFHRLVIAQDTGGAIKGPVRGDIFFGAGEEAEYYAGYMKNRGIYTLLVPREAAGALQ